ncbi:helix-turn-helix domain-containing protein [Adlercreutzia agrestimuris]|uniref:helix-turn-helix domain-containing protein n=1 Tax=Adlercreutzia agrestimuris TaxID=2941324 RepID=UPI00203CB5DE|nr:helix-turn-helix transcriptional regulator [Adlercreutzia agrestimuris]
MPQMSFGMILRDARERKGYDLSEAARRLRIRPDILLAIEENDFSRMPPRGYTRNMVNAYARLVGLNPTELTRMYLDEAYAFQVGRARNQSRATAQFDMGAASRTSRLSRKREQAQTEQTERAPRQNAFGRMMYDDRRDYDKDYDRSGYQGRLYSSERTHQSRHTALPTSQYTNFYAGPKVQSMLQSKLPIFIACGVIALLLIIVLFLVFGNHGSDDADAPKVPVVGIDDTTGGGEGTEDTQTPVTPTEVAPTSVKVTYSVASGVDAYVVITNNGEITEEMLSGPSEQSVDVNGTWSLATYVTDGVTVTMDDKPLSFDSVDANGIPECIVDFDAYLESWYQEHPNVERPKDATQNTTNNTGANGANAGNNTQNSTQNNNNPAPSGDGTVAPQANSVSDAAGAQASGGDNTANPVSNDMGTGDLNAASGYGDASQVNGYQDTVAQA